MERKFRMIKRVGIFSFFTLLLVLPTYVIHGQSNADIYEFIREGEHEVGVYPITIEDESGQEDITIYMTVVYPRTVESTTYKEIIDAKDVIIPFDSFYKDTDAKLIELAGVRAWSTLNGEALPVFVKERKVINRQAGQFEAIFQTEKGTEITSTFLEVQPEKMPGMLILDENDISFPEFEQDITLVMMMSILVIIPFLLLLFFYVYTKVKVKKTYSLLQGNRESEKRNIS